MTAALPSTCWPRSGKATSCSAIAAYDSDALRQDLAARGAWACVKPMPHRRSVPAFIVIPLSLPQPRRALLQQTQAFSSGRDPL